MLKRTGFIVALLLTVALVAACGGGSEGTQSETPGSSSGDVQRIEVSGTDFKFTPANVTVQRGTTVELVFKNEGRVAHDWVASDVNARAPVIAPGQSTTISFTPTRAGEYKVVCTEPGHEASGMVGTLIVQ